MTTEDILGLEVGEFDGEKMTIRKYFFSLMSKLWFEGDRFNSKRPFGNSGWEYDIYSCLVKNRVIEGTFDDDGFLKSPFDHKAADVFVYYNIIKPLFGIE